MKEGREGKKEGKEGRKEGKEERKEKYFPNWSHAIY